MLNIQLQRLYYATTNILRDLKVYEMYLNNEFFCMQFKTATHFNIRTAPIENAK